MQPNLIYVTVIKCSTSPAYRTRNNRRIALSPRGGLLKLYQNVGQQVNDMGGLQPSGSGLSS